jgi:hypothetical protein
MRLHDLYSLRRTATEAQQAILPQDVRRKKASGFWFEVGIAALLFLLDKDEAAPGTFVPQSEILEILQANHGVSREDAITVLRYLHTPCELTFPTFQPASVLEQTSLIERAVAGTSIRINASGRALFAHANLARRLDYAPDVISMLFKDLEHGRFVEFSSNCGLLVEIIRDHAHKVVKVQERNASYEGFRDEIFEDAQRHQALLHDVLEMIGDLQSKLLTTEAQARIEEYEAKAGDERQILPFMHKDLKRVAQASNALLRNLSVLFTSFHKNRNAQFVLFDMKRVTRDFWDGTLSLEKVARAMSIHGMWSVRKKHCSLFDVPQKIAPPFQKVEGDFVVSPQDTEAQTEMLFWFLRRHREYIVDRLRLAPVRFSDLAKAGLVDTETIEGLSSLVGLCFNSECIEEPGMKIALGRVPGEKLHLRQEDGTDFVIDEMELALKTEATK